VRGGGRLRPEADATDSPVTSHLRFIILCTVAAAAIALAAATVMFPLRQPVGGWTGVAFWCLMTLIGSLMPVRLPAGTTVSVGFGPVLAAISLGGPIAGGIAALVGTFDTRELRREIPWYGTVSNHSQLVVAAVIAGIIHDSILGAAGGTLPGVADFAILAVAGASYYLVNNLGTVTLISARTGQRWATIWAQDVRVVSPNLLALIPLAWLMAQIFVLPNGVGWWATPLFVVPLFTTRLAYHRYVETRELFEQTIGALANAVDARDRYTRGHSQRVSHIAEAMCRVMRLPEQEIEKIKWAGLLHDIGKIGVRDNVLLKPGPLDKHERFLMNQHPTIGAEIVAPAHQLSPEAPLIRAHHEWFNGSGYPDGVEAFDIPLGARILTVADAYEAMTSSRPYRLIPLSHEQAVAELEKFIGIQFDPEIVPVLVGLDREILDRRQDDENELPTMLHQEDPRDEPAPAPAPAGAAATPAQSAATPAQASAQLTTGAQEKGAEPHTEPESGGPPTRRALASDDVP
jgi:putative nucleotidyltransferase with HDIG domain